MRRSQRNSTEQPNRIDLPAYDQIGLVLQGGGALGSYQAGVVEGLMEAGVEPTSISGISIGALNTAIIAGNAPGKRVAALRGFWDTICEPADIFAQMGAAVPAAFGFGNYARTVSSLWAATHSLMVGQRGFFAPRIGLPLPGVSSERTPNAVSYYDTTALRQTLLRFADFDRINDGPTHVTVGAVNMRTGNLVYFDNRKTRLAPEHFMASGALPPGFPAVEIDGAFYWDGGLVSNTPLTEIISEGRHKNTLVFQVDLWNAKGTLPGDLLDVAERTKDIQYSSRTRAITDFVALHHKQARIIEEMLQYVPENERRANPLLREAEAIARTGTLNIVHLIYKDKYFEGNYKDYEFSTDTMLEHWASGLEDIRRSFGHPKWFEMPSHEAGFVTHDVHRREPARAASHDTELDYSGNEGGR
jgi:NTE family protein